MDTIIVPFTDKEIEAMRYLPQVSMLGIEALGVSHRQLDSRSHAPSWWLAMLHQLCKAENISILFILMRSKFQDTKRYRFIRLHRLLSLLSSIKSSYLYCIQPSIWKWEFSINYSFIFPHSWYDSLVFRVDHRWVLGVLENTRQQFQQRARETVTRLFSLEQTVGAHFEI